MKRKNPKPKRARLKNETDSRTYRIVWKELEPYWDDGIYWHPKLKRTSSLYRPYGYSYHRMYKRWNKKKIMNYQRRMYRTWKHTRKTQYKIKLMKKNQDFL